MARPKKDKIAVYNTEFAKRLRYLMDSRGIKQQQLADHLGVSRQMITPYCDGSVTPDIDKLVSIADFFNVSSDFLIGMSAAETNDFELKSICDYTGLPQEAVEMMHKFFGEGTKYKENFLGEAFCEPEFFIDMNFSLQRIAQVATMLHLQNQEVVKEMEEDIWGNVHMIQRGLERLLDNFIDAYLHGKGYKSTRYTKECIQRMSGEGAHGNDPQENK